MYVHVQKQGYYMIPGRSNDSIRANEATSLQTPAVFVLKNAGTPQPLLHNEVLGKALPLGAPMDVSLSDRKPVAAGRGHIRVEVWVDGPPQGHTYNNFPWHCRVSVPGGGMVERTDPMAFEAPADDYHPSFEVIMKPGEQWRGFVEKDLFLRLPDQTYARGRIRLGVHAEKALVSFESYWNQSGSRNLEAGANDFGLAK